MLVYGKDGAFGLEWAHMYVYLNGKFIKAREAKISVFDAGFLYGDGIFETLRTYNKKIWQMEDHLDRLFESAKMRGWKLIWTRAQLKKAIEDTTKKNDFEQSRVRVMITPGVTSPTLFIWVQPLEKIPESAYKNGVSAITFPLERPFPQMKTTSMQALIIARMEMMKKKAFEALLINRKGCITEGTWTNIFIVKKKRIVTPRFGVLLGTTRGAILKLSRVLFRVKQRDITRRELFNADECFLTNSPKGIVPVVKIDGEKIGTGKPGPITKHLLQEFEKRIKKQ